MLFEYEKGVKVENSDALLDLLKLIWQQHNNTDLNEELEEKTVKNHQPFLKISSNEIKANNYVGFIQTENDLIEIYPKVFRNCPDKNKNDMIRHILFWMDYCRKWKFPFNQSNLERISFDEFPELIINLIANQFLYTITNQPLTMYQFVEEAMQIPKGSVNFKRYVANSMVKGNFQNIECDYEPFLFDNKINRAIKFCSRLLMNKTKLSENLQILQEIIFILDDVDDIPCNSYEIENIRLNSFFEEYNKILDSCKLILNQQLFSSNSYDFSQWCLLLPMEYIFEDFVVGFIDKNFSDIWMVEYQKSNEYLSSNPKAFNMKHDIFLTFKKDRKRKLIIDTKYKLRSPNFKNDEKKGILQSDLYQVTSYAFRRGCKEIILLYPNLKENINEPDNFEIYSGFNKEDKIRVTAMEIPFWTTKNFDKIILENKLYDTLKKYLTVYK